MGKFVAGDVVIIPFPFSDLSGSKRRPAGAKTAEVISAIVSIIAPP